MAVVGALDFMEATMEKTRNWLSDLSQELRTEDYARTWHILRSVLHALRDRLPPWEAVDLAAQFPTMIRGMYYDGWNPLDTPVKIRSANEFLQAVQDHMGPNPTIDANRAAHAVFALLNARISAGEISDVRNNLPEHIRDLWPT